MSQQAGPGKLLYIINNMDWFWSHRLPLAVGARDAGWNIVVAASGASTDEKLRACGFTGIELPSLENVNAGVGALKLIAALRRVIREEKPDLVHAITLKYAFMAGIAARSTGRQTIVHTVAGLGYLFSGEDRKALLLRLMVGPLLRYALNHRRARIIFQNPDDMSLMIRRNFASAERSFLIRSSGVDLQQFPFVPEPEVEPPVVLMPTRLVHDKGVRVFVEAAKILKRRGVKARFQIAGGLVRNNPLAVSEAEMREITADGAVEWLGRVEDMPGLLANCNLVVYPSYYGEGVPKVLLEAAATGRAIVTTDHPGCREAVLHNATGLLVPVKDAKTTADAIEILLNDTAGRRVLGRAARALMEKDFEVSLIVGKTLAVYGGER